MNLKFILPVSLCLAFCLTPTHAAVRINGQNYVPVTTWARAIGLHCMQPKRDEVVATNRTTRLVFSANSHYVEINGVQVALSFPVASDRGVVLIAQFDLDAMMPARIFSRQIRMPFSY